MDDTSVRVAVRIRPQIPREIIDMCRVCTSVTAGEPQVWLGSDKAFTYDYVFDITTMQATVYSNCVENLVDGCFDGYNATVLAYGQTGSGKTYTMGTGFDMDCSPELQGIIPRAVQHFFQGIDERRDIARANGEPIPDFKVHAQFLELYNEEIIDLFDTARDPEYLRGRKNNVKIHEDVGGGIYCVGVTSQVISSAEEALQCLRVGALSRTTASTAMNEQSSRSHAIFTIHLRQQRVVQVQVGEESGSESGPTTNENGEGELLSEFETLTAKFHFVDLAGSERLKRTRATGERAKEGISINCGLLALGNVISALGDKSKKVSHVPYRDSKLTRLLQDSLGGNSRTVMIACVSPSDRDFMETLNTLKYANRARNIKNRVTVNQDKTTRTISLLRQEIQQLQLELVEYKQGKRVIGADGVESINDMFHENTMLQAENNSLRTRVKALQDTVESLTTRNVVLLTEKATSGWTGNAAGDAQDNQTRTEGGEDGLGDLVKEYLKEIEELRAKLCESDHMCVQLRKEKARRTASANPYGSIGTNKLSLPFAVIGRPLGEDGMEPAVQDLIEQAKRELERDMTHLKKSKSRHSSEGEKEKVDAVGSGEKEDGESTLLRGGGQSSSSEESCEEEEDEEEDDATDEMDEEKHKFTEELAELTSDISLKQKLIEELEMSQRRLHTMRQQYEEKLMTLQNKIKATQEERDKVLASLSGHSNQHPSEDKVKRVKEDYERKIGHMQQELRRLQVAQKEHARLVRNQTDYERQLRSLKGELGDMKRCKVKLMTKIKEETTRRRDLEMQRNKEVAQLRKEGRKRENQIRTLEAEKRLKETVLRRKQEEVAALRQVSRSAMSSRAQGRLNRGRSARQVYSPKAVKTKWQKLEKSITQAVLNKQTMSSLERDMERWLKDRERLSRHLERLSHRRSKLLVDGAPDGEVRDLDDQMESIRANIDYVQENLAECQQNVVQLEEAKEGLEAALPDATALTQGLGTEESHYIIDKLLTMALAQGLQAAQKDATLKELEAKMSQEMQNNVVHQQLLNLVLEGQDNWFTGAAFNPGINLVPGDNDSEPISSESSRSSSPFSSVPTHHLEGTSEVANRGRDKVRQRAATTEELLYSAAAGLRRREEEVMDVRTNGNGCPAARLLDNNNLVQDDNRGDVAADDLEGMTQSLPSMAASAALSRAISRVPSAPGSLKASVGPYQAYYQLGASPYSQHPGGPQLGHNSAMGHNSPMGQTSRPPAPSPQPQPSPTPNRRAALPNQFLERQDSTSPRPTRKIQNNASSTNSQTSPATAAAMAAFNAYTNLTPRMEGLGMSSPPASPTSSRRSASGNRDEDVFCRLTLGTAINRERGPSQGVLTPYQGRVNLKAPLHCLYIAEGHSKAVLSVCATEDLLFSGSQDRTVKVWDLCSQREIMSLTGHPNNVVVVRYSEPNRLVFTVSSTYIKVWDLRVRPASCIKTLSSSGLMTSETSVMSSSIRKVQTSPGEALLNDVELNVTGTTLYSAAGDKVRIWDLRRFMSIGKLSGGHQAAVMCLSVGRVAPNQDLVVTGSKDHYIKAFEVMDGSGGMVTPKMNLDPPHYDGIQCLSMCENMLFSGSRDMCIKKWDLDKEELVQSVNNAHRDWICGMCMLPGRQLLFSGCRGGFVKLWSTETCQMMGELRAHNAPINAITTNGSLIFTAASDNNVVFWTPGKRLGSSQQCSDA